ncbi:MAG: DUF6320 domain-containing protein [Oscillospiraceae bacterium]|jgi:hypothetical protein|nr:DUF6320 domain-containing protein [Oscillospiraceae bacterium]
MTAGFEIKHTLYPRMKIKRVTLNRVRGWTARALLAALVVCGIVNLAVGGPPWSFLVAAGECILYRACLAKEPIEATLLQKLMSVLFPVCGLLLLTDWFGGGASEKAMPLTYLGVLCLSAGIYFLGFRKQRKNLLPMFQMLAVALVTVAVGFFAPWGLNWPRIVLLGLTGSLVILALVGFRRPIVSELRRRFSAR